MNLIDIIGERGGIVAVSVEDLAKFGRGLIEQAKIEFANQVDGNTPIPFDEALKILGISKTTAWRWAKEGYLVPFKVGGVNFYRKSDIQKIVEGGK
jgi:predicted DNA-binding transcriptional regulator AlpA